jgi:hypothetical protein
MMRSYRRQVVAALAALTSEWLEAFRQGLREQGYTEGVDIVLEQRHDSPGRATCGQASRASE